MTVNVSYALISEQLMSNMLMLSQFCIDSPFVL